MKKINVLYYRKLRYLLFLITLCGFGTECLLANDKILNYHLNSEGQPVLSVSKYRPKISPTGRFVVFSADPNPTTLGNADVYIKDMRTKKLALVSTGIGVDTGNGVCNYGNPDISESFGPLETPKVRVTYDGFCGTLGSRSYVVDIPISNNSQNPFPAPFPVSKEIGLGASGGPWTTQRPSISGDGNYIAFERLDGGTTPRFRLYRIEVATDGSPSVASPLLIADDPECQKVTLNRTGDFIVYRAKPIGSTVQIYRKSITGGIPSLTPDLVSSIPTGGNGNGDSDHVGGNPRACDISDDGKIVVFVSSSTNLVSPTPPGMPGEGVGKLYIRDYTSPTAGVTSYINVAITPQFPNPSISGDGRTIVAGGYIYDSLSGLRRRIADLGEGDDVSKSGREVVLSGKGLATEGFVGRETLYLDNLGVNHLSSGDFNGDGFTEMSVFRPNGSIWYSLLSYAYTNSMSVAPIPPSMLEFNSALDKLVPGDYDGDGKTDYAYFKISTGTWVVTKSADGTTSWVNFGLTGDIPVPLDYDGDNRTDYAVFRPSSGIWYYLSNGSAVATQFGVNGDLPRPGDYDGDGKGDFAIFRPSNGQWWYLQSSDGTNRAFQFGISTDKAVPADYTGDGKTDIAIFRPSTGEWYILRSDNFGYYSFPFGLDGDKPTPGDYDNDGKTDAAVWRPSDRTFYVNRSSLGFISRQYGIGGNNPDIPVASVFYQ
jgi:hypothetical protein